MWSYSFLQARTVALKPGEHGGAIEARYRLRRTDRAPIPHRLKVDEKIRVTIDTHKVASHFKSGANIAESGFFNDRYLLASPSPFPSGFRFEIEQTYTISGAPVAGKNKVVYTGSSVLLYVFERGRWKLYGRGAARS